MKQKVACAILAICLLGVVFTGCEGNDIPAVDEVEQVYQENRDYIQLVVDFMINIDYNEIIINDSSGNIWPHFAD